VAFADRRDAGRRLAERLAPLASSRPVVIALPRGGVPVAVEVARALSAPLDVLGVRKLGAPGNPELAVGAIAEGVGAVLDVGLARRTGMTRRRFASAVEREEAELARRVVAYRRGRPPLPIAGRSVIVVDDGVATGLTEQAAIVALRARGARRITVAVPVGAPESIARLARECDEVVCHTCPQSLRAVGCWYEDFAPLSDHEVIELLAGAAAASSHP
jgi:predicted phosphoribosyltransferase